MDKYEEISVEIPNDLHDRLIKKTRAYNEENNMNISVEDYCSMILENAMKSGEFKEIVLKEMNAANIE